MKIDLKELEALARAATPGPWSTYDASACNGDFSHVEIAGADGTVIVSDDAGPGKHDSFFIAAANPAAILELVALASAPTAPPVLTEVALRRFDFTDPTEGSATMDEQPDGWWVTYDEALAHTAAAVAAERTSMEAKWRASEGARSDLQRTAKASVPVAAIPEGWSVRKELDGDIVVSKPGFGGYAARSDDDTIASAILHEFASDILAAPQQYAQPNLTCVIYWLEAGCDPLNAAKELRAYQKQMGLPDVPELVARQHAQAAQPLVPSSAQVMADAGLNVSVGGMKVQPRMAGNAQAALSDELPPLPRAAMLVGPDMESLSLRYTKQQMLDYGRAILATFQPAPRVITKDNAKDFLEETLWTFIETSGNFPSVTTDPRTWEHVMVYAPVASAPVVPVDADALRAAGRSEALAILMRLDPEVGIDDYTEWRNSGAPEDEGSAFWKEDKLRELFVIDGSLADMMDKAEGEYWYYKGLQMEAEHAKNFAANMHNSGKVRDVLAKSGEHDLIADLCKTAPQPSSAPVAAAVQGDANECLQDVVSHHGDLHMACTATRDLHLRSNDTDSAAYWDKQLHVLARMKVQAEAALAQRAASQPPRPAYDWCPECHARESAGEPDRERAPAPTAQQERAWYKEWVASLADNIAVDQVEFGRRVWAERARRAAKGGVQ